MDLNTTPFADDIRAVSGLVQTLKARLIAVAIKIIELYQKLA